jgi:hypothetical protein
VPATLAAGSQFEVAFEARDAAVDRGRVSPSPLLVLWHHGKESSFLLPANMTPNVLAPKKTVQLPAVALHGGAHTFRVPRVEPGSYTLCGSVGLDTARRDGFCTRVAITGT